MQVKSIHTQSEPVPKNADVFSLGESLVWAVDKEWLAKIQERTTAQPESFPTIETYRISAKDIQSFWDDEDEPSSKPSALSGDILVVDLKGVMLKNSYRGWFVNIIGTSELSNIITKAGNDPSIKGIIIRVDSGGGESAGVLTLSQAIVQANKRKPVYTLIDGTCASAAYWAVSGARGVYTSSLTDVVGSVGAFIRHTSYEGMAEMEGIKVTYIVSKGSENKVVAPSEKNLSPEHEAKLEGFVTEVRDIMVKNISANRPSLSMDEEVLSADVFMHQKALSKKLIDGMDTLEGLIKKIHKEVKPTNTKAVTTNTNTMSSLKQRIFASFGIPEAQSENDTVELTGQEAKDLLAKRDSLSQRIDLLEAENTDLKNQIATLSQGQEALQSLKTEKVDLESRILAFESSIADLEATKTTLQADLGQMTVTNAALVEQVNDLKKEAVGDESRERKSQAVTTSPDRLKEVRQRIINKDKAVWK